MSKSVIERLHSRQKGDRKSKVPEIESFKDFLLNHARVRVGSRYVPYHFEGREVLEQIVDIIDLILGSKTGESLSDADLAICGGAQFGKTILVLLLIAYLTGVRFKNVGYYLPDDDLVEGIVDGKFRPDVVDQIPWYADLFQAGRTLSESGRSVNRKGAFMVRDLEQIALGYIRGMGKIPTSFSMDTVIEDEKDDIPPQRAKFLKGRMTASDQRMHISIGTQRLHGAGQYMEWEQGSQGVMMISDGVGGDWLNPEENFPQIVRLALDGTPSPEDPCLTWEGDFRYPHKPGESIASYDPEAFYYLADPVTGKVLDRRKVKIEHRRPDRIRLRKWSVRVSQIGIEAIDLKQIVSAWTDAVRDPDSMISFCCDRLALPKNTSQALSPQILQRARDLESYSLSTKATEGVPVFAGVDTGDRCWFVAREVESPLVKRIRFAEKISSTRLVSRVVMLTELLNISCLFVDAHPLLNEARQICWALNRLDGFEFPKIKDPEKAYLSFGNGLAWDGPNQKWVGIRAAAVQFTLKPGQGTRQVLGKTQDGKFYPIIQCNRDETIQRVINEFLTPDEQVIEVIDGAIRRQSAMRLPIKKLGGSPIVEDFDNHHLAGSKKEDNKDGSQSFVDDLENHLLLANAYSGLAETLGEVTRRQKFAFTTARGLGGADSMVEPTNRGRGMPL